MNNPIKEVYRFNKQAGLLGNGYDDLLESSMLVEEALEGFDMAPLCKSFSLPETFTPKEVSRVIINSFGPTSEEPFTKPQTVSNVDRLDKACDATIIAIGSMAKLGLNPQQITKALNIVMQTNFTKLGMPRDEYGKLTKPDDFVGPEAELQLIMDEVF